MAENEVDGTVDKQTDNGSTPSPLDVDSSQPNAKTEPFKKPLLIIGPQRGKSQKTLNKFYRTVKEPDNSDNCTEVGNKVTDEPLVVDQIELRNEDLKGVHPPKSTSHQQNPSHPLEYKEPEWGGFPAAEYKLEVRFCSLTINSSYSC